MCCGATLGIHPLSKDFITFILGILRLQLISFSGWFVYDCSDLYDETNVYFRGLIILETLSYFFTIPKIAVKTLESHNICDFIWHRCRRTVEIVAYYYMHANEVNYVCFESICFAHKYDTY